MNKSASKKAAAGKSSPMMVGLLLGLILGVGIAAALAWYMMKTPSPFAGKESAVNKPVLPEKLKAAASEVTKTEGEAAAGDGKPRFEFYKVLTDKQDASSLPAQAPVAGKPVEAAKAVTQEAPAHPAARTLYYLQAGAFASEAEAEKLKAGLLMDGMEVTVLAANIPDKGVFHRVRTGPYQSVDEMNKARAKLELKGIHSAPMRAQ